MNESAKTWIRAVVSTSGAILAGPTGAVVGSLLGGFMASLLPGISTFASDVARSLATRSIISAGDKIAGQLSPQEKIHINHDLQTAFRDGFHEALLDIGGEDCFPILVGKPQRDVPKEVVFPLTPNGKPLWHQHNPLAGQVKDLLQEFETALEKQEILPLNPPADKPSANVKAFLAVETPQGLDVIFFEQNVTPILGRYKSLLRELPEIEIHLRKFIFPRCLVHLTENLKHRTSAWRAYNRMVLETIQSEIAQVSQGQTEIVDRLDILIAGSDSQNMAEWSDRMADLLGAIGKVELVVNEGFEELSWRVIEQHREILVRFDLLTQTSNRIETKVDRVLRFLDDGKYTIDGQPTVPIHRPAAPGAAPFMGLQFYGEADADRFFGRERLISRLVGRLYAEHFLAVIGASGSGKSSVVRAGLIPVLKGTKVIPEVPSLPSGSVLWPVKIITPTDKPLTALASSLGIPSENTGNIQHLVNAMLKDDATFDQVVRSAAAAEGSQHILLVVDQFEELFSLHPDEGEQKAFVDNLLKAASPGSHGVLILIIILRADFYADCAIFENLRQAISEQQEYIGPMNQEELKRAIIEPAEQNGWRYEPGLVDHLVREAGNEPGALPLLSHALLETWRHRSGHTMTLESYAESGGVKGAIAKTAELIFNFSLNPLQQVTARNIFLRMTNLAEGSKETRRRVTIDELIPDPTQTSSVEMVLKLLSDARLITTEDGSAELAHEAIIHEWPKLRGWLEENRAGLLIQRRLTEAAQEWARLNKEDDGMLYRGFRLEEAAEWRSENEGSLNSLEREFLERSLALREREAAEKETQHKRELESAQKLALAESQRAEEQTRSAVQLRKRAIYLSIALAAAGLLVVLAIILAGIAVRAGDQSNQNAVMARQNAETAQSASTLAVAQQVTAESERSRAELQQQLAQSRQLVAQSQSARLDNYPIRSILLSIEAFRQLSNSSDSQSLQVVNALWRSISNAGGEVIASHAAPIVGIALSKDGRWLAVASSDFTIRLWALNMPASHAPVILTGHSAQVSGIGFTQDSKRLVSVSYDATIRLWDVNATDPGSHPLTLTGHKDKIITAALSPDGHWLVSGSIDKSMYLWDLTSMNPSSTALQLKGHTEAVYSAGFSPDNRWLATGGADHTVLLWDLHQSDPNSTRVKLSEHTSYVWGVVFSPNSRWLATVSQDRTARLWDVTLPDPSKSSLVLSGHDDFVSFASFSPDGHWLLTGSADHTIRRWDMTAGDIPTSALVLRGHSNWISGMLISQDGKWLVSASLDRTARVWDLNSKDPNDSPIILRGHDAVISALAITPDSSAIYTGSDDGSVRKWDLTHKDSSPIPLVLRDHTGYINDLSFIFNKANQLLAIASSDRTTHIYDIQTKRVKFVLSGHQKSIYAIAVSPDQSWLVTTSWDTTAILYHLNAVDPSTASFTLKGHEDIVNSAVFTPDNHWLFTGSKDGTVRMWDLTNPNPAAQPTRILTGHTNGVSFISLDPGGRWLFTASWAGMLRAWDLAAPASTIPQVLTQDCYGPLATSSDGKWIASACFNNLAYIWKVKDLSAPPIKLTNLDNMTYQLTFTPDSHWLVTTAIEKTVRLWDMTSADPSQKPIVLRGHTDEVFAYTVSSDSRWLATGGADQIIRVWDLKSADPSAEAIELRGHIGKVLSLAFSPDDNLLASGSEDGTTRLWTMRSDDLVTVGCKLSGRNLTVVEWDLYFFGQDYHQTCPNLPLINK